MKAAPAICILLILSMLLPLTACAPSAPLPCDAVLSAMLAFAESHPAGKIYRSSAAADDEDYLSDALSRSLYGVALTAEGGIAEFSLYLSRSEAPFELAVLRCHSASKAAEIAALCHARIELLRHHFRGKDEEDVIALSRVLICGNTVLMVVSTDADKLLTEAKRVIKERR